MAFQQPTLYRPAQQVARSTPPSLSLIHSTQVEESQEWILFAPSQAETSTHATSQTVGLSRASDLGSLQSGVRSGPIDSSVLDDVTEDDLDSLDDGLHAFREPPIYQTTSNGPVLPTHDGLGTFPASAVLEQLWRHEQHNPKRKHEGHHRRVSSFQKRFDNAADLEAQDSEEKRIRIEKWRLDQSRAILDEVERETRQQLKRENMQKTVEHVSGSTPKQGDLQENVPFWRRITRKFIRDVIGIDDPLLSVILGESLPGDVWPRDSTPRPTSPLDTISEQSESEASWRDRLLQRIARELGVFVHQLSPHPGAFTSYQSPPDYAGIPIRPQSTKQSSIQSLPVSASTLSPNFPPTLRNPAHAESWGFEDEPTSNSLNLQKEREYWERELDVKLVFSFLRDRFVSSSSEQEPLRPNDNDASATRAAIIRQHHPLVARAHRSPVKARRESRTRRPGSSCASESIKSGLKASRTSSRNYWDLGGSMGSGSLMASGGLIGAWGEV